MDTIGRIALVGLLASAGCIGKRGGEPQGDAPQGDAREAAPSGPARVEPPVPTATPRVESALAAADRLRTGDLVFLASHARHAKALAELMPGELNHVGIVFVTGDGPQVIAADARVDQATLAEWLQQTTGRVVVKRLGDLEATLSDAALRPIQQYALASRGKAYDFAFEWSDDAVYSAEFVHKAFARGPEVELGHKTTLEALGVDAAVATRVGAAYGVTIAPQTEVVTPMSIFEDARLTTVFDAVAP